MPVWVSCSQVSHNSVMFTLIIFYQIAGTSCSISFICAGVQKISSMQYSLHMVILKSNIVKDSWIVFLSYETFILTHKLHVSHSWVFVKLAISGTVCVCASDTFLWKPIYIEYIHRFEPGASYTYDMLGMDEPSSFTI